MPKKHSIYRYMVKPGLVAAGVICLHAQDAQATKFMDSMSFRDARPADELANPDPGTHLADIGGEGFSDSTRFLGPFVLHGAVNTGLTFDDNILLSETGEESDFIYEVNPVLALNTDWDRHEISVWGGYHAHFYQDNSDEDYEDWEAGARLTLDVTDEWQWSAGYVHDETHSNRLTLLETLQVPRVKIKESNAHTRVAFAPAGSPIRGRVELRRKEKEFEPTAQLDLSSRNRTEHRVEAYGSYAINPDLALIVQPAFTDVDFTNSAAGSTDPDSYIYEFMTGVKVQQEGLWQANLSGGIIRFDRQDSSLENRNSWIMAANFLWTPWEYINFRAQLFRNVLVADYRGATEAIQTGANMSAIYHFTEAWSLQLNTGLDHVEFDNVTREDDNFSVGFGAEYTLNDNMRAGASYNFLRRDSNLTGESFDNNLLQLNLQLAL